jgi:hypothetical protein
MTVETTAWRELQPGWYEAALPRGRFVLRMSREDLPFREICDFAIRNNLRRRFLFVSKVLGRHHPVRPEVMRGIASRLAAKLHAGLGDAPAVFVGMAETATTLGQAVYREFIRQGGRGLYIESTRRPTGGEQAFGFSESHSHATAHVIHQPGAEDDPDGLLLNARHLVVVDDEATTAKTAAGLVREMRRWRGEGGVPFDARLAVILHWHDDDGHDAAFSSIESLAEGSFEFVAGADLPEAPPANHDIDGRVIAPRGVRHGSVSPQSLPGSLDILVERGQKILVVGNGEFGFMPLLLAERLEEAGAEAWVQATTRSPILPGGAIGHVRSFPALSGEGYTEFLYNVPDQHDYDRVILFLEDPAPEPGHPILQIPRLEVVR